MMHAEHGWEQLYKRRENHGHILMYKIINGLAPDHLSNLMQPYIVNINDYNLRQQTNANM